MEMSDFEYAFYTAIANNDSAREGYPPKAGQFLPVADGLFQNFRALPNALILQTVPP